MWFQRGALILLVLIVCVWSVTPLLKMHPGPQSQIEPALKKAGQRSSTPRPET